jgi:hypothetical protein
MEPAALPGSAVDIVFTGRSQAATDFAANGANGANRRGWSVEPTGAASRPVLSSALVSLTAIAALTSCSGPGGSTGTPDSTDVSSGNNTMPAAPPGKYQTLPEPCGSVDSQTLHAILPSSQNYTGTAVLTYDPDRRAGCKWNGTAPGGTRNLSVDFERVVSYDPTVSDDDKAAQEYEQMAQAAHIPGPDPGTSPSPPAPASASAPASAPASGTPTPTSSPLPSNSPAPSDSAEANDTTPRRINGLGDAAYLNDVPTTVDGSLHRDVTVVFRIANVLVTVQLSQGSNDKTAVPPSAALQLGTLGLAQQLVKSFNS